jgi:hypothetical protein
MLQRTLSLSYEACGDLQFEAGDWTAAKTFYEKMHAIRERLSQASPDDMQAMRDFASACDRLGNAVEKLGDQKRTLALQEQAALTFAKVAKQMPNTATHYQYVKLVLKVADTRERERDVEGVVRLLTSATEIMTNLVRADPANATFKSEAEAVKQRLAKLRPKRSWW